ncbi:DUF771 domain-containing protein [Planococcus plakortidis]
MNEKFGAKDPRACSQCNVAVYAQNFCTSYSCRGAEKKGSPEKGRRRIRMQKLNIELSVEIPGEYVLITKVEYEELKSNELRGVYWNMKELEKRTGRQSTWLKENVLYPERFRKVLDIEYGGFVAYPKSQGQPWTFSALRMEKFLDENFSQIFHK